MHPKVLEDYGYRPQVLTNSLLCPVSTVVHRTISIFTIQYTPLDPVCVPDVQPLIKWSLKLWLSRSLQTANTFQLHHWKMSHGSLQPTTRFSKLGSYFIWVGLRDPNIFLYHVQHVGTADEIACFKVSSRAGGARHGVCKTCVPVGASIFQRSAGNTQ